MLLGIREYLWKPQFDARRWKLQLLLFATTKILNPILTITRDFERFCFVIFLAFTARNFQTVSTADSTLTELLSLPPLVDTDFANLATSFSERFSHEDQIRRHKTKFQELPLKALSRIRNWLVETYAVACNLLFYSRAFITNPRPPAEVLLAVINFNYESLLHSSPPPARLWLPLSPLRFYFRISYLLHGTPSATYELFKGMNYSCRDETHDKSVLIVYPIHKTDKTGRAFRPYRRTTGCPAGTPRKKPPRDSVSRGNFAMKK